MMTVCFLPINSEKLVTDRKKLLYRYIKPIKITCNIKKDMLYELIYDFLKEICEINIFGFNKSTNEYWCKNVKKSVTLHFTITIIKCDNSSSCITITPILGRDNEIKKILLKIVNLLNLYDK